MIPPSMLLSLPDVCPLSMVAFLCFVTVSSVEAFVPLGTYSFFLIASYAGKFFLIAKTNGFFDLAYDAMYCDYTFLIMPFFGIPYLIVISFDLWPRNFINLSTF